MRLGVQVKGWKGVEEEGKGGLRGVAVENAPLDAFPYKLCEKRASFSQAPRTLSARLAPAPAAPSHPCFSTPLTFFTFFLKLHPCFADYLGMPAITQAPNNLQNTCKPTGTKSTSGKIIPYLQQNGAVSAVTRAEFGYLVTLLPPPALTQHVPPCVARMA